MSLPQAMILILVAGGAFAGGVLACSIWRRVRLERIEDAATELAGGNLAHRVIMPGEDRAARIGVALNALADTIQAEREAVVTGDEARRRFLTNISHDLRTPITSIAGYVNALQRGLGDDPQRYLAVIAAKSEDLTQLTDDLFYAARLDANDLELELKPLDLAEAVRRSVLGFEPQFATNGVEVDISLPDEPCTVDADASAVARILGNLISNAIRHAPEMTAFGMELSSTVKDYVVRICNDDARLPDDPERLFERGVVGLGGGAGIGLSIARELAERMGASLGAESSSAGHAEFTLAFPRHAVAKPKFRES